MFLHDPILLSFKQQYLDLMNLAIDCNFWFIALLWDGFGFYRCFPLKHLDLYS